MDPAKLSGAHVAEWQRLTADLIQPLNRLGRYSNLLLHSASVFRTLRHESSEGLPGPSHC